MLASTAACDPERTPAAASGEPAEANSSTKFEFRRSSADPCQADGFASELGPKYSTSNIQAHRPAPANRLERGPHAPHKPLLGRAAIRQSSNP